MVRYSSNSPDAVGPPPSLLTSLATRYPTHMAIRMAAPPMVGVPRFFWCVCGPSSRISWPKPCRENTLIR